jgi:putative chitinase
VIAGCHYRKIVSLWSAKPPGLTTYIVAFEIFDGALDTGIVAACLIFSFKQRLIQEEAHMPIDVVDVLNHTMPMMPDALSNYTQAIRQSGQLFERAAITTPRRMAHFLGQTLFETGRFTILRENMNYSAQRLFDVFGVNHHSAAVTLEEADNLAHHPEQIAERVYGLGNPHKAQELGNEQPGDGFRYRGNGVLQMTGRSAHRKTGQACGVDFEGNPDLATVPQHALTPALQEWTEGGLNAFADKNDIAEDQWRVQWSSRTQADV